MLKNIYYNHKKWHLNFLTLSQPLEIIPGVVTPSLRTTDLH